MQLVQRKMQAPSKYRINVCEIHGGKSTTRKPLCLIREISTRNPGQLMKIRINPSYGKPHRPWKILRKPWKILEIIEQILIKTQKKKKWNRNSENLRNFQKILGLYGEVIFMVWSLPNRICSSSLLSGPELASTVPFDVEVVNWVQKTLGQDVSLFICGGSENMLMHKN